MIYERLIDMYVHIYIIYIHMYTKKIFSHVDTSLFIATSVILLNTSFLRAQS